MQQTYDYLIPKTLDELFALRAQTPGAKLVAGGTDLFVQLRKRKPAAEAPAALISLRRIPELARIDTGDTLRLGAAVSLTAVAAHAAVRESFPALIDAIRVVGSPQIRNVATLGGNLCNASPAADTAPPLIVYAARVELRSPRGSREVPVEDFFTGPGQTVLANDEILAAILLPPPGPGTESLFMRKGRITMDLAIASLAVAATFDADRCIAARVAAGAVAPVPLRLPTVEALLVDRQLDGAAIEQACAELAARIEPISDLRSSADYRRTLCSVFLKRVLAELGGRAAA